MTTKKDTLLKDLKSAVAQNMKHYNTAMADADKKKPKLFIVDTIETFRRRYVIEALSLEHAYDEVTMKDSGNDNDYFEEFSQKALGETIIDGRRISRKDFDNMLTDLETDNEDLSSYWMEDKLVRKIKYE